MRHEGTFFTSDFRWSMKDAGDFLTMLISGAGMGGSAKTLAGGIHGAADSIRNWGRAENGAGGILKESVVSAADDGLSNKDGTDTTRVGRWMSQEEYDKMISTGMVQPSQKGMTHVACPSDIGAFGRQAKKGSLYVEFDIPNDAVLTQGGAESWKIIHGPGSPKDKLSKMKGLPGISQMPKATNIKIGGKK